MPDHRSSIESNLQAFPSAPLRQASLDLLGTLGYRSDKTVDLAGSKPKAFLDFITEHNPDAAFDKKKSLVADWKSADILFQLTDEEISREASLFQDTSVKPGLLRSYLFFAIELNGDSAVNGSYARGRLTAIARQINRVFPMPVMVLIKHPEQKEKVLSIAVINRRQNKRDTHKDVLGKVTIIRDISLAEPHRGHKDILDSFAFDNLDHPKKQPIADFDSLHAAWEQIFNVELLNKKFYRELANWYFWAMKHCHFPLLDEQADKYFLFKDRAKVREHEAKNLIRLLTRTLFVWFIKERGLVPDSLFHTTDLKDSILKEFDPESKDTNYYKAVLQNLYFATLNQTQGKREFRKSGSHQNTTTLLRYEDRLKSPGDFISTLENVTPFLNGGLFECLDYPHPTKKGPQGGTVIVYEDGFSDRKDNPIHMPDFLFFGEERIDDLSGEHAYGEKKYKNEEVRGLIHILNRYKFTIVENTPIDQEIALDPELLGQVFENLLASYNPETKTTARKQSGSFYTPRPIVDYMVDESLKTYLTQALVEKSGMGEANARGCLDLLFQYREANQDSFKPNQVEVLITAIDTCKILDPACGSGAFPMGILQKLVYILSKLDPDNERWKQTQLDKLDSAPMREALEADFANNDDDYGRKLYLIENCLYGVDIQSIATQVSKLRFFISLIVDQHIDKTADNFGVRPLPNLETKFVTANTLIQLDKPDALGDLGEIADIDRLKKQLKRVRHALFTAKTPKTKNRYREEDKTLREQIASELQSNGWGGESAKALAHWDPYDQNASEDYFDPDWMLGEEAFDIVIGNPPWGATLSKNHKAKLKREYPEIDSSTPNSFAYFIGAALRQSRLSITFVLPDSLLIKDYARTRQLIAPNITDIAWYLNTGVPENCRQFVYVEHDVCVVTLDLSKVRHECKIRKQFFDSEEEVTRVECYKEQKRNFIFAEHEFCYNLLIREKELKILRHLAGHSQLGSLTQCHEGIHTGNSRDLLFHDENLNQHCRPLFYGGRAGDRIANYHSERKGWYVDYRAELVDKSEGYYASLRDERIFKLPKIYITRTGNPIKAFYDDVTYASNNFFSLQFKNYEENTEQNLKALLPLILSSLANYFIRTFAAPRLGNTYIETKIIHLNRIPVSSELLNRGELFLALTDLMIHAVIHEFATQQQFLSDLIDACVMECYFREHMAERDILFHDDLSPHLSAYEPEGTEAQQRDFLNQLYQTLNAPSHPIRNRLLRLTADSPDLLAVIKQEGKV
jgi:adenine-specific DNA-methyltransferase